MLSRGSVEGTEPGERGLQDCLQIGTADDGVLVYLHVYVDSYSRLGFAELRLSGDGKSCAGFFAKRVMPFFDSLGLHVRQVVTRPTEEYSGASEYHRALVGRGIERAFTDAITHEQNLMCAELSAILCSELGFKNGEVARANLPALQKSLEEYLRHYNHDRPHKRRGLPPYAALLHAIEPQPSWANVPTTRQRT